MRPPYSITREKPVVTVLIEKGRVAEVPREEVEGAAKVYLDNSNLGVLKNFHCCVCGGICFQYYGSVRIIMAGHGRDEAVSAPIVIQCKQNYCKTLYSIVG